MGPLFDSGGPVTKEQSPAVKLGKQVLWPAILGCGGVDQTAKAKQRTRIIDISFLVIVEEPEYHVRVVFVSSDLHARSTVSRCHKNNKNKKRPTMR